MVGGGSDALASDDAIKLSHIALIQFARIIRQDGLWYSIF